MKKVTVSIIGGSGYTGGELIRLLIFHPQVEIKQVTSERMCGKPIFKSHPNLRKISSLKFCKILDLESCDILFLCLPHGKSMAQIEYFCSKSKKIIDLSADFRLNSVATYEKWYKQTHSNPKFLSEFVYGIPEFHREMMKSAKFVSSAGCNATATLLSLYPLFKNKIVETDHTVVEVKVGSSEGGNKSSSSTHHPERSGSVRSFKPIQHRHIAEIEQELSFFSPTKIHFSATSIEMVRGVLATSHVFLKRKLDEKDIWKIYRESYSEEPFIRLVKDREGNYRFPEPKLLIGTNYCDIGFELDPESNRLVVISAIDNLMKGAAGQAVQAFNIMYGFKENVALQFPGLHPI
jgi:N-acetyl-gamma-glutamyl-phosphate/LysW-gamma-L-alpha-aminoadipyl-6-phosphate reductase